MQAQTRIKAYLLTQRNKETSSQEQQSFSCDFNFYFQRQYNQEKKNGHQKQSQPNHNYFQMPKQIHNDYRQKVRKQRQQLQNRPLIRQLFKNQCPLIKTSITQLSSITHQTDLETLRKSHFSQQKTEDQLMSQDTNRSHSQKELSNNKILKQSAKPKQYNSIFNQQLVTEATFKPRHLKTEGQITANYNNIKKLVQQKLGTDFIKPKATKNSTIFAKQIYNQSDYIAEKTKENLNPNLNRKGSLQRKNVFAQKQAKPKVFKADTQTTYQRLLNQIYNKNQNCKNEDKLKCVRFQKTIQLNKNNSEFTCFPTKLQRTDLQKKNTCIGRKQQNQEKLIKRQSNNPNLKIQKNMQKQKRQLQWINLTFEQRQRKSLDNKQLKQEHWKRIRATLQTKQCTFKPKIQSTAKIQKPIEMLRRSQSYSQIHRNKLSK